MGNLLYIIKGMEVSAIPEEKRDTSVKELAELVDFARKENDNCYLEKGMNQHKFKYGNFFIDFVFANWKELCKKDGFKGIQQKTFQLLYNSCTAKPSLGKEIPTEEFESNKKPSAKAGLDIPNIGIEDYTYNYPDWKRRKNEYLQLHQDEIDWKKAEDSFLPFRCFSDGILYGEIEKHNKQQELKDELRKIEGISKKEGYKWNEDTIRSKAIANVFHEKIMRMKGNDLFVYACEIGKKICLGNAYVHDEELSRMESKATGQNRYIYRILNSNKELQYISIDTRHGMFEFHDKNGDHLGEYRFNGEFNSDPESDHSFKSIRKHKK